MDLTREEFIEHFRLLRDDVKGVHTRLDVLNGRTRAVETEVAVLKDRADQHAELAQQTAVVAAASKASAMKWGAGIGAAMAALIAGLTQALGGK